MTHWLLILLGAFVLFFFAGCYSTDSDVKEYQRQAFDFNAKLMQDHDRNMTEQHKVQTPAVSSEIEALRQQNALLMTENLELSKKKTTEYRSDNPLADLGPIGLLFMNGISAVVGGLITSKTGTSRAAPAVAKVDSKLDEVMKIVATLAGKAGVTI